MLEILNLKPESFALDISDFSLKIIKLKKRGNNLTLASFGEKTIKPGIIKEGEIKDEAALLKILKDGLSNVKGEHLKTKYVIASLPEEKAFSQVIQLPRMSEEDLKSAVVYEAENYVPLPIEETYLDFQIVQPFSNHLDHFDILLAALPKKIVDSYVSVFKKAGLLPKALEIESSAIARAMIRGEKNPRQVLLIDFGLSKTSFIIFSGNSLRFTSSIRISSTSLTDSISKNLGTDLIEAEKLKIKYGLEEKKADKNKKDVSEREKIFSAMMPVMVDLVQQIKKHLEFYLTHSSHEHLPSDNLGIEKILLCGGGANLKGFSDFLSMKLKIPVEIGNPWVNILKEPLKEVPELSFQESLSYTTALGLALRAIRETSKPEKADSNLKK